MPESCCLSKSVKNKISENYLHYRLLTDLIEFNNNLIMKNINDNNLLGYHS